MDRPEFKWPCRNAEAQLTNPVGMAAKSVFQSIIPFKFGTLLSGRNFGSKMIGDLVKTFDIFFCTIFPGMTYKRRFGFQRKHWTLFRRTYDDVACRLSPEKLLFGTIIICLYTMYHPEKLLRSPAKFGCILGCLTKPC